MKRSSLALPLISAICWLALSGVAQASPVLVNVRIEGATRTIFEAPVLVEGRNVTTETGGTHECNGTNGGANAESVPVPTAALADAAMLGRFTFDAEWFPSFEEFLVTRIAETSQTGSEFWGILVNYELIPVGGCQFRLHNGDQVLFAFNAFDAEHFLKLSGPNLAFSGHATTVKVTEGATGEPIAGAEVGPVNGNEEVETNAKGEAAITFRHFGLDVLKASKPGSIRSNSLVVLDL